MGQRRHVDALDQRCLNDGAPGGHAAVALRGEAGGLGPTTLRLAG